MHRDPGVLHHLLRLGAAADDAGGHPHQRGMEAPHQAAIRCFLAGAQAGEELGLVELAVVHGCAVP